MMIDSICHANLMLQAVHKVHCQPGIYAMKTIAEQLHPCSTGL